MFYPPFPCISARGIGVRFCEPMNFFCYTIASSEVFKQYIFLPSNCLFIIRLFCLLYYLCSSLRQGYHMVS